MMYQQCDMYHPFKLSSCVCRCWYVCIAAAGASFEVTDPDKGNPAQIAAYWGHLEAVVKLVEAGCSWPHGKTARGVAGGDVVKWICNITTNKVRGVDGCLVR
jgi:hypothetical protein